MKECLDLSLDLHSKPYFRETNKATCSSHSSEPPPSNGIHKGKKLGFMSMETFVSPDGAIMNDFRFLFILLFFLDFSTVTIIYFVINIRLKILYESHHSLSAMICFSV